MTAALRADGFLRYDLGAGRIADPMAAKRLAGLQDDLRASARVPATDLVSATRSILSELAEEFTGGIHDPDGAIVTAGTLKNAETLVQELYAFLPLSVSLPDILPEPDGEVSLTWQAAPNLLFSISVGESGTLSFASRLAQGVEFHGKAQLGSLADNTLRMLAETIAGLFSGAPSRR